VHAWRLLLIGFGTVGRGVATRLQAAREDLATHGVAVQIVGVADPAVGSIACPDGLEPGRLLELVHGGHDLTEYAGARPLEEPLAQLTELGVEVVFEMTPTDLRTGGVGLTHVRGALDAGCHVATTNKGPIALAYPELAALAARRGVQLKAEGTVLSGTPVLNLAENGLVGAGTRAFRGVLNGTCNFILCQMEEGCSYAEALIGAQELGYAEADPTGDVEGWDAAAKVSILANLVLGAGIVLEDVERRGIADLDAEQIRADAAAGTPWRLVGQARRAKTGWRAEVAPRRLAADDPLARARGATNGVVFETDALGEITIVGPGAGRDATGHALVADLVAIHRATRP